MKKVLFATTAIVAFAGAASAQSTSVALSGSAEMGIIGGNGTDTTFLQSVDVRFSLRGATDNGLSFGATFDVEDAIDSGTTGSDMVDDTGFADYTVFISGDWGTLTMGDTDGAMDWALTEAGNVANPGSIADNETGHAGYLGSYLDGNGGDGQIVRYDTTFGAFGVAVSVEQNGNGAGDTGYAIGLKYALDLGGTTVNLGVAHQVAASAAGGVDPSATGVSATAAFGAVTAGIVYTSFDNATLGGAAPFTPDSHLGIGVGYKSGPISVHANYGKYDLGATSRDGYGLAAAYDLGGGASVKLGFNDNAAGANYSLGVAMSF